MDYKELFRQFIEDEDDLLIFARWAFGEDYFEIKDAMGYLKAWNEIHAFEYELKPSREIYEDAKKMVELWKARE